MMDREEFRRAAVRALQREIPDGLDELLRANMPQLHWRNGEEVEGVVPRGWLAAAVQRGQAEPNEATYRDAALFDPTDALAFATWLLDAWIRYDTAAPQLTDARRTELRNMAEQAAHLSRQFDRPGGDSQERYQQMLDQELNRPAPSALPYRGLLAVVAVCGDESLLPSINAYLARWRSERPEQCDLLEQLRARLLD